MSRYNTRKTVTATSPLKTVATGATHEGGPGFKNDTYGELFRLGVNLFAGKQDTFYEKGADRDARFGSLVEQLAVTDPAWLSDFLYWLRHEGNIRTASVLGAVHAIHARLEAGLGAGNAQPRGYNRNFAASIPNRLDEVPELFAIWQALFPGEAFPQALKRGAGDALKNLISQYSLMKYDTKSHGFRIADVLSIAHVKPSNVTEAELFKMALSNRYGETFEPVYLDMVSENIALREEARINPEALLNPVRLKFAGMTWEDALSLAGNRIDKRELWEALILGGSMGYMALLRNLRNFQEAGIGTEATQYVKDTLANPRAVEKSRQLPFRFYSAYVAATGTQWADALETALTLSTKNVPVFEGKTLALIDTSASMGRGWSARDSKTSNAERAALFAGAVALRNPGTVDLYMYANGVAEVKAPKGGSLLRMIEDVNRRNGEVGHGTETARSVKATYKGHDRVLVFTDMQSFGGYGVTPDHVNPGTWVYHWDLSGYEHGDIPSGEGRIHQLAGLTDASMRTIPLLENGARGIWPWQ